MSRTITSRCGSSGLRIRFAKSLRSAFFVWCLASSGPSAEAAAILPRKSDWNDLLTANKGHAPGLFTFKGCFY
jgi:hypothetical protein